MSAPEPSIIAFERRAGGYTAMLGVWAIGEVQILHEGDIRASWRLNLTGISPVYRYARSIEEAQIKLTRAAMEWIDTAGLAPALPIDGVIRSTNRDGDGERKNSARYDDAKSVG